MFRLDCAGIALGFRIVLDCFSIYLRFGKERKHWRGDVMELLGLPTNAQVCTMLTHESCGVPPLSGLGLRKEPIGDYCTRNQVRVTSVCEIVCTL